MKESQKRIIEEIIHEMQASENGIINKLDCISFLQDKKCSADERNAIIGYMRELDLISSPNRYTYNLTMGGSKFTSFNDIEKNENKKLIWDKLIKYWIPIITTAIALTSLAWNIYQTTVNSRIENRIEKLEKRFE